MTLAPLEVTCPQCGSHDVFYSCKPECCFNHVCNKCYTTFELETTRVGEFKGEFQAPPESDPTQPTAPCARCGEWKIFAIRDGENSPSQLVCVDCRALLTLHLTNIEPG
jgi:hypothetical protein